MKFHCPKNNMTQKTTQYFRNHFNPENPENCKALSSWVSNCIFFWIFLQWPVNALLVTCKQVLSHLISWVILLANEHHILSPNKTAELEILRNIFPLFSTNYQKFWQNIFCEILQVWWMQIQRAKQFLKIRIFFLSKRHL